MKKSILILITFVLTISTLSFSATHVITVDQNATSDSAETVSTIEKALELAKELNPSEDLPVLIKLGQGEFPAPETEWKITSKWIFFAGNGTENTRIVADKIELDSEAITSFKDIYIDSIFDIGDIYLPVDNIKVLQLEKKEGQLDGVWQNAVGELQLPKERYGDFPIRDSSETIAANNIIMFAPDEDATNTFVLKTGDTMTGLLNVPNINLYSSSNIYGYLVSGSSYPTANGIYFDNGNIHNGMAVYENKQGIFTFIMVRTLGFWDLI